MSRRRLATRFSSLVLCVVLLLSGACGDDGGQTMDAALVVVRKDARVPDSIDAGSERVAAATASLTALADGGVGALASWRVTSEGVDLRISLQGCTSAAAYGLSISDAPDCAQLGSSAAESALGRGLPLVQCFGLGGVATTVHARAADAGATWTIGGGGASDLVGRLLVVREGRAGAPLACGKIARAEDLERTPQPPVEQAPSIAVRATVGGVCLGRQVPGSGPSCPDNEALLRCEAVHCELGACLQACEAYADCIEQQQDACDPTSACVPSAECTLCMSELQTCSKLFCGEEAFCPPLPTPDGPCHRLANCAVLQGKPGEVALAVLVPAVSQLGGDEGCIGSMNDWAVVSQWRVPCLFGASEPPVVMAAPSACETSSDCGPGRKCARRQSGGGKECLAACSEPSECPPDFVCAGAMQGSGIVLSGACHPKRVADQLADHSAGRACTVDADCGGGTCSAVNLLGTGYPGNYCTARCYEDAQCGQGGVCLWTSNSDDLGYCLASCNTDADCTREGYGCWEMSDGARVFHACYPRKRALPDRRAGQPCTLDADCGAPEATCAKQLPYAGLVTNELVAVPGGYCTQHCALDIECGAGAQCLNYGTSGGLCLALCTDAAPCRAGYTCSGNLRDYQITETVCLAPPP